ncbi:hypothetical protein vseg_004366 [Gypsophila vaccaria]
MDNSYPFLRPQSIKQQFNPKFQPNPIKKTMCLSNLIMKLVLITLFLCVIPLFPTEPPEFITHTFFAKTWELIHLLVIGIALSYGLFCRRRNPELKCGFGEDRVSVDHHYSSVFDCRGGALGGDGIEKERPLGLPVRSLRCRVLESDSEEEECESECGSECECSEDSCFERGEKGGNFEGNVGGNGWGSRSVRAGFVEGGGGFGVYGGKGENFEGVVGGNGWESRSMRAGFGGEKGESFEGVVGGNGWESRSMRAGFGVENGGFEVHCGKGESFEGIVGSNRWESGPRRAGFGVEKGGFEVHCGKGESFDGTIGSNGYRDGWGSRSMRAGFVDEEGDFKVHCGKDESFEENVGNLRSVMGGFNVGNGGFEVASEKGESLVGNVGGSPAQNGWHSRSMRTWNREFELHCGKGENFDGNVGRNVSPNEWKSRSMRTNFMAQSGNVELASGKGENLEGNVGNYPSVPLKSRSMRADFMVKDGKFESDLSKAQSFRSPIQGASYAMMNAGFCSWLPESPNMVAGNDPWNRVTNMPFTNFYTQGNDFNLAGSTPTLENHTTPSNFFMPSTTTPPSVTVSTSASSGVAPDSMMYNYENCDWGTPSPILEPANKFVGNSAPFMPLENDVGQPTYGCSPKKDEENFIPQTPEVPPSIARPAGKSGSSVRTRRSKSKLGLSGKKSKQQLEKDIDVGFLGQGDDSGSSSVPTSVDDVALPSNGSVPNKNEDVFTSIVPKDKDTSVDSDSPVRKTDFFTPKGAGLPSIATGAPTNEPASFSKAPRSPDFNRGTLHKKDDGEMSRGDSETPTHDGISPSTIGSFLNKNEKRSAPEQLDETPKHDVIASSTKGSFLKKNEQNSIPEKWDEDCFVIPLSENNDIEDPLQVVQDDPAPELASLSDVASSSCKTSCDEQRQEQINGVEEDVVLKGITDVLEIDGEEEDVVLKGTTDFSEIDGQEENVALKRTTDFSEIDGEEGVTPKGTTDFSEIEAYKPSTPSPPARLQIRGTDPNILSSVESSSRALSDGFLLNEYHDNGQGSPLTLKRGKSLSKASDSRGFSCTSFFDRDLRRSFKNEAREENRRSEEDQYVGKTGKCSCLSLDVRPTLSKAALKGKSVRTVKPREVVPETTNSHNVLQLEHKRVDDTGTKEQNSEMVLIKIGISEKRPSSSSRKREKKGNVGTSIIVGVNSKGGDSNTKAAVLCDVTEDEPDSEIDKKADEFIAKFKEQIRLQKVSARTESSRRQLPKRNSLYRT